MDWEKEKKRIIEYFTNLTDEEFGKVLIDCGLKENKSNKLNIQDLDKLKVTKIKDWAIYFDYDEEKYLLHEEDDYEENELALYKRNSTNINGKYDLDYLYSVPYICLPDIIYNNKTKSNGTLSQINKKDLVWKLTWKNVIDSLYSDEINRRRKEIEHLKNLQAKLDKQIRQLRNFNEEEVKL